jgi:sortase (surface protein transpeptidase)
LLVALAVAGCSQAAGLTSPSPVSTAAPERPVPVPSTLRSFSSTERVARPAMPVRLQVPAIGVDTPLERLGQTRHRVVEVPRHWQWAGWYRNGPRPGEAGAAVILGHVDSPGGPAVFARASSLRRGDRVTVRLSDGSSVAFRVSRVELRPRSRFPAKDVYWPTLRPELRLITCGGAYIRSAGGYQSNVIVFATSVGSARAP